MDLAIGRWQRHLHAERNAEESLVDTMVRGGSSPPGALGKAPHRVRGLFRLPEHESLGVTLVLGEGEHHLRGSCDRHRLPGTCGSGVPGRGSRPAGKHPSLGDAAGPVPRLRRTCPRRRRTCTTRNQSSSVLISDVGGVPPNVSEISPVSGRRHRASPQTSKDVVSHSTSGAPAMRLDRIAIGDMVLAKIKG
jgi:hypothetical protein